jgi:cyanophycinase
MATQTMATRRGAGPLVLVGGGEWGGACRELDAELLAAAGAEEVVVLPTAAAYEHPERVGVRATEWFGALGVEARSLAVLRRADAEDPKNAEIVRKARYVHVADGSPLHLRSVLKGSALFDAMLSAWSGGAALVASGAGATLLCDPMVDPRGGAFTLGLGLVNGLALVTEAETWSAERLHRTLKLANIPVAELPSGAALVHTAGGWEQVGDVTMHGELPD